MAGLRRDGPVYVGLQTMTLAGMKTWKIVQYSYLQVLSKWVKKNYFLLLLLDVFVCLLGLCVCVCVCVCVVIFCSFVCCCCFIFFVNYVFASNLSFSRGRYFGVLFTDEKQKNAG